MPNVKEKEEEVPKDKSSFHCGGDENATKAMRTSTGTENNNNGTDAAAGKEVNTVDNETVAKRKGRDIYIAKRRVTCCARKKKSMTTQKADDGTE